MAIHQKTAASMERPNIWSVKRTCLRVTTAMDRSDMAIDASFAHACAQDPLIRGDVIP